MSLSRIGLQQPSRSSFLREQKTKPLQPMPGETGAEQPPRVTVRNGLLALPTANPNELLSVSVACVSVCVWCYDEESFPVLCKLESLLQVVFSAVCSEVLESRPWTWTVKYLPLYTQFTHDLSSFPQCVEASPCWITGFTASGNNILLLNSGGLEKRVMPTCESHHSVQFHSSSTTRFLPTTHLHFSPNDFAVHLFTGLLFVHLFYLPLPICSCCWASLKALSKYNGKPWKGRMFDIIVLFPKLPLKVS